MALHETSSVLKSLIQTNQYGPLYEIYKQYNKHEMIYEIAIFRRVCKMFKKIIDENVGSFKHEIVQVKLPVYMKQMTKASFSFGKYIRVIVFFGMDYAFEMDYIEEDPPEHIKNYSDLDLIGYYMELEFGGLRRFIANGIHFCLFVHTQIDLILQRHLITLSGTRHKLGMSGVVYHAYKLVPKRNESGILIFEREQILLNEDKQMMYFIKYRGKLIRNNSELAMKCMHIINDIYGDDFVEWRQILIHNGVNMEIFYGIIKYPIFRKKKKLVFDLGGGDEELQARIEKGRFIPNQLKYQYSQYSFFEYVSGFEG
jgi:hypothetical protein